MIGRWLSTNIITVFIIILWSLYQGYDTSLILIGKLLSQAAFILFLININMYFVFLLIRKSKIRPMKVKLAQISKRMMKYHIPIAITATILIIGHGVIMLSAYVDSVWTLKMIIGLFSIGVLIILLYSGLLRRWKSTGKRRKFHYIMAFVFFGCVLFHIFI